MKKIILATLTVLVLNSCVIKGSFQGLYSYYHKTKSKNPNLFINSNTVPSICDIAVTDETKIYITNGTTLKKCINNRENVLVYIWAPKCKSKIGCPLELVQQKADSKNLDLFIIAEYYDSVNMKFNYKTKQPIYAIDTEYYKSNLTSKYIGDFIFEMTAKKDIKEKYLYFKKGVFMKSYDFIEDIPIN